MNGKETFNKLTQAYGDDVSYRNQVFMCQNAFFTNWETQQDKPHFIRQVTLRSVTRRLNENEKQFQNLCQNLNECKR